MRGVFGVAIAVGAALVTAGPAAGPAAAAGCADPRPEWLMCEDFEGGGAGWSAWFDASPFVECLGCRDGENDPARIRLVDDPEAAHAGRWSLHMPSEAAAGFQGASLTYRDCRGDKRPGCALDGHKELYFRTFVRLAEDHSYVHHFLAVDGTRPNEYWACDGNAGCRPTGTRWAGTTLDLNARRELFFYTYFPEMRCDRGGYCSGDYARQICEGCAAKGMPCGAEPECCWGNHFAPEPPVVLDRGRWVCLEMMASLNTPGEADGEMAFWVDDRLAHRQTGMHWRDVADLQLNKAWLQHYIAAGDAEGSNRVWFDDVVVSTERIGCRGAEQPTPAPTAEAARPIHLPWASAPRATSVATLGGPQQVAEIVIDTDVRRQTIRGWEATAAAGPTNDPAFETYIGELLDRAVDELGITRLRLEVRSGAESNRPYWRQYRAGEIDYETWRAFRYATVDDNDDPDLIDWRGFHFDEMDDVVEHVVLPMRSRLAARGSRLGLNVNYVAFTSQITQGGAYGHDRPDEYAEFVLATHLHLRDRYGLVPDSWEVILEPDNVGQWNGTLIGQAMVASGRRLDENGFASRFVAPSTTNMARAATYFDALAAVPGAVDRLRELSYHRYGGVSDDALRAIAQRGTQYGIDTAMLEHIGSGSEDLYADLAIGGNAAWQQYTLGGPGTDDNGGRYYLVDLADPARPAVRPARRTPYLAQTFRHVRPGARIVGAESSDPALRPIGFVHPDGTSGVVVTASESGAMRIAGLPAGEYEVSHTTASGTVRAGVVDLAAGAALPASIPGAGVLTASGRQAGRSLFVPVASRPR